MQLQLKFYFDFFFISLQSILNVSIIKARQIVTTFVKQSATKPGKNGFKCGMRYESSFLIQSLLLKMKSPRAYRFLRDNGILPLPHPNSLRPLLSSSDCGFVFNKLALEHIAKVLNNLDPHLRYGTLMLDEMSIIKDLSWDSKMLRWNGVINFGSDIKAAAKKGLADHVLVLVYRPFRQKWVQPIGWFGSKGAADGTTLAEIIIKATVMLYKSGAIVKAMFVTAMLATNQHYLNWILVGREELRTTSDIRSTPKLRSMPS